MWLLPGPPEPGGNTVIVILVDTLRRDALGCYGNPDPVSPHIDALAEEGVQFEHAVSTSGWTLPAIASLLSGTWPTLHGASGKGVILTPIRDELPTAAEVFKREGYRTFAVANAAFVSPMLGLDRGFEVFDHKYAYNWDIRRADASVDAALAWLRETGSQSSFVFIHLFDPHVNYDPPPGYATKFTQGRNTPPVPLSHGACVALAGQGGKAPPTPEDIAYVQNVYHGEVNFVDAQIGRLMRALKDMGRYEQSTIVITADHGEEFWEHGGFEHGHTLYDELIAIPLVVKLPVSVRPAEQRVGAQVRIVDIMPTLFDLSGVNAPATFLGESLVPYFNGEAHDDLVAFSESTLYGDDKLSWRTERYKYVVDVNPSARQRGELYDWRADPGEHNNLVETEPALAKELDAQLTTFFNEISGKSRSMSQPEPKDLNPQIIESLESLGYLR